MTKLQLTPEELLTGANVTFDIIVPPDVLQPGENGRSSAETSSQDMMVQLRPLTIGTFQLIIKAAKHDAGLIPVLMVKESLVQPTLSLEQVKQLHLGLINFLISHIRQISGLTQKKNL
ncbi:MAG: hypothetical protein DWQ04_29820 [Chloroflexi bacterium]|nr:MAG: hypothetical protein DWQ04_29820 [Chloroflexota bacterium]